MKNLAPIEYISPSSFYYWEKCPLKAVYARNYDGPVLFPIHPDADLGKLIHSFIENRLNWEINTDEIFEKKWNDEVQKLNNKYRNSLLQKVYFPIEWHSKYFAVRKRQLQRFIVKDVSETYMNHRNRLTVTKYGLAEKWIDDKFDIGGKIDYVRFNDNNEIEDVIDYKTGNIFEIVEKEKIIKPVYYCQLALYGYLVLQNQSLNPNYYLQDSNGEKHKVEISQIQIEDVHKRAVKLKSKINEHISRNDINSLASPMQENCSFCDYRPLCEAYKTTFINDFSMKYLDVHGKVVSITYGSKMTFKIQINERVINLRNIVSAEKINEGDEVYVYNLFCPDQEDSTLFATKSTIVIHE